MDVDGITHRGNRYFAGECQRLQPALRRMLFSSVMADICRATLGDEVRGRDPGERVLALRERLRRTPSSVP